MTVKSASLVAWNNHCRYVGDFSLIYNSLYNDQYLVYYILG